MRTIGNIERFLVLGIVVVIGAILAVAITGARDLERDRESQVAAKSAGGKPGSAGLKSSGGTRPQAGASAEKKTPAKKDPAAEPSDAGASRRPVDPEVAKLLEAHRLAMEGNLPQSEPAPGPLGGRLSTSNPGGSPAPSNPPGTGGRGAILDQPEVIDDVTTGTTALSKAGTRPASPGPAQLSPGPATPPPAPGPDADAKQYVYEVQKGDTLERIARALYGEGRRWTEILAANPAIHDAHTIREGETLKLPKAPMHESPNARLREAGASAARADAGAAPRDGSAASASASAASGGFKRLTDVERYEVKWGDTLMSIAAANYGTRAAWRLIFDSNPDLLSDKDQLRTGVVLKLPAN
jgi:nucleoid-associated protein YgaU